MDLHPQPIFPGVRKPCSLCTMTLSRGAEWEATDRRETEGSRNLRRSRSHVESQGTQLAPESQSYQLEPLEPLEPKMSIDSIAPTLVVKTPDVSEHSDATPPKHRNAKGRVLRAASSLAPDKGSLDEESHDNQSQTLRLGGWLVCFFLGGPAVALEPPLELV